MCVCVSHGELNQHSNGGEEAMLSMYMFELIQLSAWWEQVGESDSIDFHDYLVFYCNIISQLPLTPLLLTLQIFPPPIPHHSLQIPLFLHHTLQMSPLLTPHYTPDQMSPPHKLLTLGIPSPPLAPHLNTTTHHSHQVVPPLTPHHCLQMSPPHYHFLPCSHISLQMFPMHTH